MLSTTRLNDVSMPHDVLSTMLDVYKYLGRNDAFFSALDTQVETFVASTIREDTFFLAQILGLSIKEERLKSLILKDLKPKSHDEIILTQIKHALVRIHENIDHFELIANEIVSLIQFIYGDVAKASDLAFDRVEKKDAPVRDLLSTKTVSKRSLLEGLVDAYNQAYKEKTIERGLLATSFYLDFTLMKPFKTRNELIGLLMLYILLLNSEYRCFQLVSFFGIYDRLKATFHETALKANQNATEGLSHPTTLHRLVLSMTLEGYKSLDAMVKNVQFDHQFNKRDLIENTIKNLPEVFTKDDVRLHHPSVSESTIDRTLKRLKDEKKISPLGKGRSAQWMKLHSKKDKLKLHEQMRLKF